MRREQRGLRPVWRVNEAYEEIMRGQCWFISVNFSQDRRSLCVLSFLEAITPRLNKLRGSARRNLYALRERNIFSRVFSRQAAKVAKTLISLLTPCSLLANPLRSLCALCGFARKELLSRDIFLAKLPRPQRGSMNIFATTFHDLCFFSNNFPRLFTTYARCRSLSAEDRASVGQPRRG